MPCKNKVPWVKKKEKDNQFQLFKHIRKQKVFEPYEACQDILWKYKKRLKLDR